MCGQSIIDLDGLHGRVLIHGWVRRSRDYSLRKEKVAATIMIQDVRNAEILQILYNPLRKTGRV